MYQLPIILLAFVGISYLMIEWDARRNMSCIAETKGYITSASSGRGGIHVEYTYRVNGQSYYGIAGVAGINGGYRSPEEAQMYLRGRTVTVHYNPVRPRRSWVDTSYLNQGV